MGDSIGFLRAWINVHPDQFNYDAWLFCGIGHDMRNKSTVKELMNHAQVYRMFSKVKNRAIRMGFPESKRIYPHMFRHNRATELTSKITASVLEKQMGWVPGTKQRAVYEHLNNEDVDIAMLSASGINMQKKLEIRKTRVCIACKTPNPANSKYCLQCGRPLDFEEARILNERSAGAIRALKESEFTQDIERDLLGGASQEFQDEWLLKKLEKLNAEGKLSQLFSRIREKGHDAHD